MAPLIVLLISEARVDVAGPMYCAASHRSTCHSGDLGDGVIVAQILPVGRRDE